VQLIFPKHLKWLFPKYFCTLKISFMKKVLLALFILLTAGQTVQAQNIVTDSIMAGGVYRKFIVYLPANAGTNRPLILNFHGLGSNATEQLFYSGFAPIADTAKFIIVFPQGLSAAGNTYWNVGLPLTQATGTDDVGFVNQLIDTIQARYTTDPTRTYACGFSLGGYMSHYLACKSTARFAAIASVSGTIAPNVYNGGCTPSRTIPVMQIHGTDDVRVPYGGNGDGIHIDTLNAAWVRRNSCNPTPTVTQVPNSNPGDGSTVTKYVWAGGPTPAVVEFFKVTGGTHTWPGSPITLTGQVTNGDISASGEIWRFFSRYSTTRLLSTGTILADPNAPLQLAPNPARDYVELNTAGTTRIYDLAGRLLLQSTERRLDVRSLASGVYILELHAGRGVSRAQLVKE
jgi:polyhydroxybutyrate depolymerase